MLKANQANRANEKVASLSKKWNRCELIEHIRLNLMERYSSAVIVGALYKKLYGGYPKIGLSGFQASAIDSLLEVLPDKF